MERRAAVQDKGPQKFLGQRGIKVADLLVGKGDIIVEKRAVGEINADPDQASSMGT